MRTLLMVTAAVATLGLMPVPTFAQAPGGHAGEGGPGAAGGGAGGGPREAPGGGASRGGEGGGRMQAAPRGEGAPAGQPGRAAAPPMRAPTGAAGAGSRPADERGREAPGAERGAGGEKAVGGERGQERGAGRPGAGAPHAAITGEQRTRIRSDLRGAGHGEVLHHPGFETRVGGRVPERFRFAPLPPDIIEFLPEYRGYDYVEVDDAILIIDPATREIVYVIE